ncbi:MAG TPA: sigma factor-like helix-turn-helix DNA-binding protein, partial [Chitinophagaceae bacterium]|nr:sigma factor-like helix-turn-helix DNA-binding protein [Chitinophagaceae bacterium]
ERNFSPGTIRSEQAADRPLLQKKLQQVYESLSEKEKTLFQLRFEKKLGLQQIANQMNMPLGSVKSGLYNLQKKYHPLIQHFSYEN